MHINYCFNQPHNFLAIHFSACLMHQLEPHLYSESIILCVWYSQDKMIIQQQLSKQDLMPSVQNILFPDLLKKTHCQFWSSTITNITGSQNCIITWSISQSSSYLWRPWKHLSNHIIKLIIPMIMLHWPITL